MISLTIWIALIVFALLLLAYVFLVPSPIPYSEIVALVLSTVVTWIITILYASGNVVNEEISVVKEIILDNVKTYEYELLQYPVIDGTVTALLITVSIAITLYCLYILIPTIVNLINGDEDND